MEIVDVRECLPATDDAPLRQGDVFEWIPRPVDDSFRQYGLIVTADCDLAHEKHQGIISYVPVFSLRDYIRLFDLPKKVDIQLEKAGEALAGGVRKMQKNLPGFEVPMSASTVLEWVERKKPEDVLAALGIQDSPKSERVANLIRVYDALLQSREEGSFDDQLEALVLRQAHVSDGDLGKARQQVMSRVVDSVAKLPGDAFFVGCITDDEPLGHVAYLRMVREINHDEVAIRVTGLDGARAKRVSRMQSPFLYRLTQQLGDVFASIGLPADYEAQRRRIAEALATSSAAEGPETGNDS